MEIVKADISDLADIYRILRQGADFLHECGVDQWTCGYPQIEIVKRDIQSGCCYKVLAEDRIVAAFTAIVGEEPNYTEIYDGAWLTEGDNYCTIHRISVANDQRGKGIASLIYSYVEDFCAKGNISSIRIDTHKDNLPQLKAFEKNGFKYCGIIYVEDGGERVAYEKILETGAHNWTK